MKNLIKIQNELKAPKNQFNKFGGYKYRSCEDIMEAIKPLLAKYNCWLTINDDIVEVGGRIYVKATARIHDAETGEEITNTAFAREAETKKGMDESQITGASSSYARKYLKNMERKIWICISAISARSVGQLKNVKMLYRPYLKNLLTYC